MTVQFRRAVALTPRPPLSRKKTRERGGKQIGSQKRKKKDGLNRDKQDETEAHSKLVIGRDVLKQLIKQREP